MAKAKKAVESENLDVKFVKFGGVAPEEIEAGDQSRWCADKDAAANYGYHDGEIDEMVKSFERNGQIESVLVRKLDDGKLTMVAGYKRWLAAGLYNARHPDAPMTLTAKIIKCSDEAAYALSVAENVERKSTSPIDDAMAQDRLRQKHGWSNSRIAGHYRCDPAHVTRLQRILTLPDKLKVFVHTRMLPVNVAYELATLSPAEQENVKKEIVQKSKDAAKNWKILDGFFKDEPSLKPEPEPDVDPTPEPEPEKPAKGGKKPAKKPAKGSKKSASEIAGNAVRKSRQQKASEAPVTPAGEAKPRSIKTRTLVQVIEFFQTLTGPEENAGPKAFALETLKFIRGGDELDYEKFIQKSVSLPEE